MRIVCKATIATLAILLLAVGCADQMLDSDRARASISGSLVLPAADVTIVDTRANGRFVCTINGGNIMTFGMTNGALCRRPGAA